MTSPRRDSRSDIVHVTDNANRGEALFAHPGDHGFWLECLAKAHDETGLQILHFCLMTNHVHLIVRGAAAQISDALWHINTPFARRLRYRHDKKGAIFAGRYHSEPVESDRHYLLAMRYVSANPVKAGLATNAGAYRWSAHRALVGDVVAPHGLDVEAAMGLLVGIAGPRALAEIGAEDGARPEPEPITGEGPDQRAAAMALRDQGLNQREIASRLDVHQATISRLLRK